MPTLDVSDVLLSPEFCDEICYTRRQETYPANGRVSITPVEMSTLGVVCIGSMGNEPIEEDQRHASNLITVHSVDRLLDVAKGFQPDLVQYNGLNYVVRKSYNWSHYGAGFFAAECELMNLTTKAPSNGC